MKLGTLAFTGTFIAALAAACGGRTLALDPNAGEEPGGDGGAGGTGGAGGKAGGGGAGGKGGSGGSAGKGGAAGSGGSAGAPDKPIGSCAAIPAPKGGDPNKCGTETCPPGMFGAAACCYDSATNSCGVKFASGPCLQLSAPGDLTADCPDQPNPNFMAIKLKGCCMKTGYCGVNDTTLPLGCTSFNDALEKKDIKCGCGK